MAEQAPVKAQRPPISWQPSSGSDPAIWPAAHGKLEFRNNALGEPRRNVKLGPGTRIFARIAPREWSMPSRVELEQRISDVGLNVGGRDGDWGLNDDGALSVRGLITGERNDMHVTDATQWFQSNGELWGVNSTCFDERGGGLCFASMLPFTPLDELLRKGVAAIRAMGGKGPIGIILGVSGDLITG